MLPKPNCFFWHVVLLFFAANAPLGKDPFVVPPFRKKIGRLGEVLTTTYDFK